MYLTGAPTVLPARRFPGTLGCDRCTTRRRALPLGHLRGQGRGLGQNESFLAAGTRLAYNATWGNSFTNWNNPNGIASSIMPVLNAQWGIVVDSQFHTTSDIINFSGGSGFTLQVHTTRDYGSAADVKSIIDGELSKLGVSLQSSNISITVGGLTPTSTGVSTIAPGATLAQAQQNYANAIANNDSVGAAQWAAVIQQLQSQQQPFDLMSFLSNNAGLIAAGVGAIALFAFLEHR